MRYKLSVLWIPRISFESFKLTVVTYRRMSSPGKYYFWKLFPHTIFISNDRAEYFAEKFFDTEYLIYSANIVV